MSHRTDGARFVHEFALAPTPQHARILKIRLELGRQTYNAMLGKARARLNRVKRLHAWREAMALFKQARALAKRKDEAGAKALRTAAKQRQAAAIHQVMQEERERYAPESKAKGDRLNYPAPAIMTRLRQAHFYDHLDFKSVQGLAVRAYQTVDQLRFKRPTRRKDGSLKFPRVHFVPQGEVRAIDSTSIHFRLGKTPEGIERNGIARSCYLEWNSRLHKLQIPVLFDHDDPKGIQAHALAQMQNPANICKSMRVLTRTIRGEERWYTQVTMKGEAAWKSAQYPPGHGKAVGIDFGPSQIGICYEAPDGTLRGAKLELAEGLRHDYARIRRLERYIDRSRRATNPQNYQANGVPKKGLRKGDWHKSKRYKAAQAQRADLWRQYAARRKNLLGRLANQIIALGTTIKIEQVSYKAWQKQWGKSIGRGAPGMLVAMLERKAEQCGGALIEFPTRSTKLSQLCHGCGTYQKKPLKQRIHTCECGVGPIDRDIYSAFLALHIDIASTTLDIGAARAAFAALQCGAVDIQGKDQAPCASSPRTMPSPGATGDYGRSSASRALSHADASADEHADERHGDISTFQGSPLLAQPANIEAGIIATGDARTLHPQENGHAATEEGNEIARRRGPPRRRSREVGQLSLFPGLTGPGG